MEHNYNMTDRSRKMVENYFFLIRNLPDKDKIALISKISNSIVQWQKKKKPKRKYWRKPTAVSSPTNPPTN